MYMYVYIYNMCVCVCVCVLSYATRVKLEGGLLSGGLQRAKGDEDAHSLPLVFFLIFF